MSRLRMIAMILGVILVALPSTARAQATPLGMKLITRNTGWALMPGGLFWTTDFGQDWRRITPPLKPAGTEMASVFFLNTSTGWVLLRTSHSTEPDVVFGDWGFELAYTDNAGASWTVTPVRLPGLPKWEDLGGGGSVDFIDAAHGWMDLSLESNAEFEAGVVFSTDDGGATWRPAWHTRTVTFSGPGGTKSSVQRWSGGAPMIAAAVRFVTPKDGWMAGGGGGQFLYSTHDGGETWSRVRLEPPAQTGSVIFGGPHSATYGLPVFSDPSHGAVVVLFHGLGSRAASLFTTNDGGRAWRPVGSLANLPPVGSLPAVAGSRMAAGWISHRTNIALTVVGPGGHAKKTVGAIRVRDHWIPAVTALSFRDAETGWALAGSLYATTDGGATWTDVTPKPTVPTRHITLKPAKPHQAYSPPSASERMLSPTVRTVAAANAGGGGGGTAGSLHTSEHLGFDKCAAAPEATMQAWWSYSPYYDVGVYIGGANEACKSQPNLTAPWVTDITGYGWGLIPFWAGPQATCADRAYASYINPATAEADGTAEASKAVQAASNLGFGTGSIISNRGAGTGAACRWLGLV